MDGFMDEVMDEVRYEDIFEAAGRIAPYVHKTPVVCSTTLNRETGAEVFFKCENLQKVGAFKARGAVNALLTLEDSSRGVVAHSSGNHGAALAYAAAIRGVPCTIVMPDTAPEIKIEAVRGYGAEILFCKPGRREVTAEKFMAETGAVLVHPYEDPRVIAGQGTAALELLEEVPDLDLVITPVGGGGLLSGTTLACAALRPEARVYGAEPKAVDDAHRSLRDGKRYPAVVHPDTLADGLLTGLGELPFSILRHHGVEVITVAEEAIVEACLFHLQRMKILVEPSAATGLAALRILGTAAAGKRVGIILSGGNTDLSWLVR